MSRKLLHQEMPPEDPAAERDRLRQQVAELDKRLRQQDTLLKKLRTSSERYRKVISTAQEGLWWTDPNAIITDVNPIMADLLGYTPEEVIGRSGFDFVAEDSLELARQEWDRRRRGISAHYDIHLRRKDGSPLWVLVSASPLVDSSGELTGILAMFIDITERKRAEESLRHSEERFRLLVESVAQAVWEAEADGTVTEDQPTWRRYTGQTLEALMGNGWLQAVHPDDREAADRTWRASVASGQLFKTEFRLCGPEGEWRWTNVHAAPLRDSHGRIVKWIGMNIDISERKAAEDARQAALQAMEARTRELQAVIGSVPDALTVHDHDGRVVFSNAAARQVPAIFPADSQETAEQRAVRLRIENSAGEPLGPADSPLSRSLRKGETVQDFIVRLHRPSDPAPAIHASISSAPIRDEQSAITGAVVLYKDISERVRAEQELARTVRRLRESERRNLALLDDLKRADENKTRFLSILSHELRNPLASIVMSLSLIEQTPAGSIQASRAQDVLKRQSRQLTRLVDDLLDITRITSDKIRLKPERLELGDLIRRVLADFQLQFQSKGVALRSGLPGEPVEVMGDPARLNQAIANLLHNALKFSQAGDAADVSLRRDDVRREAVIQVGDTGTGIDAGLMPHLFEPFSQADISLDRSQSGLGLGLAIVKGMVELHGGTIGVESGGPGQGATFTIRLPLLASQPEPGESGWSAGGQILRSLKILVVEDNKDLSDLLMELFGLLGHDAFAAANGRDGIAMAEDLRPDILFCDIGLPDLNGFEVARHIRAHDSLDGIFLVAMSGYAQPEDIERSRASGFDRHLAKPVSLDTLEAVLADVPGFAAGTS